MCVCMTVCVLSKTVCVRPSVFVYVCECALCVSGVCLCVSDPHPIRPKGYEGWNWGQCWLFLLADWD